MGPAFSLPRHLQPPPDIVRLMNAPSPSPDLMAAWAESQKHQLHTPGPMTQAPQQTSGSSWAGEFGNGVQVVIPGPSLQHNAAQQQSSCESH